MTTLSPNAAKTSSKSGSFAWTGWPLVWAAAFYLFLALASVIALVDSTSIWDTRAVMLGLALLLVASHWIIIVQHREWRQITLVMLIYISILLTALTMLIWLHPAFYLLIPFIYGHTYRYLPRRWAILVSIVLTIVLVLRLAILIGQPPSSVDVPVVVILAIFILFGILFAIWVNAIIQQSQERQRLIDALQATQTELAQVEHQSGILEERQRLAREIHDTLAQGLTSIVMHLEAAEEALAQDSIVAQQHLNQARRTARDSLTEARRFVWALRPESLERDPLPKAIMRVAEHWSEEHHLTAHTHITGTLRSLSPEIEVTLLRAAQEALANVSKHARASEVTVTLSYMNDVVALDIQDNGLGFDQSLVASTPDGDNFGLVAMRQRVKQWGGTLTIESVAQEGTTLAIEIPIDKESA